MIRTTNGHRFEFGLIIADGSLNTAVPSSDCEVQDCRRSQKLKLQSQNNRPVEEPPNAPKKPPVRQPPLREPDRQPPQNPPPPPSGPPVEEPPREPGKPPVKDFMESGKPVSAICHAGQLLVSADVIRG